MTETRNIIIELLSQLGSSREARDYLRRFSSSGSYQFAVVKVGGEVIQSQLGQVASALSFLRSVGLFPIILHGAGPQLNQALESAGIPLHKVNGIRVTTPEVMKVARPVIYEQNLKLVEELERLGTRARALQHGIFECELEDEANLGLVGRVSKVHQSNIKSAIDSGSLPILSCLGESATGQMMNINADIAARELVRAIQPSKIIFISSTGGLLDDKGQIISAINLTTDYQRLMNSEWVHSGMRLKLEQIEQLLRQLPASTSVSITSADHLTRELFTHRGAGTLITRGEPFLATRSIDENDRSAVRNLLECCFDKTIDQEYFDALRLHQLVLAESKRAAVIVCDGINGIGYMDKFAVTPEAQGEGLGAAIWAQVQQLYPQLYWRSRSSNPVNSWYLKQSDFCVRRGSWNIFGYGIEDFGQIERCVQDASSRPEYWVKEVVHG